MSNWKLSTLEILIVDDSVAVREWALLGLNDPHKFSLVLAESAEEAVNLVRCTAFDVILLDLGLPRTDAAAAVTALRELQPSVPIIALVTDSTRHESLAALRAGACTYLTKPLSADKVCRALDAALGKAQHEEQFIMDGVIRSGDNVGSAAELARG